MKRFGKTLLIVLGLGVGVVGYGSSTAHAQASVASSQMLRVDVAGGFTVIRANEGPAVCGCFYMNGGSGELAVTNSHNISFVTNVGYTSQTNIGNIDRNLALLTVLEGGRYTLERGRLSTFGQGMVGLGKTTSNYKIDQSSARLALAVGGGLDLRLSNRFSIRPAEVEYLFTTIPNGQNNFQNQLRMTAGVVFHVNGSRR
jgi:hypothetical protein